MTTTTDVQLCWRDITDSLSPLTARKFGVSQYHILDDDPSPVISFHGHVRQSVAVAAVSFDGPVISAIIAGLVDIP